MIETMKNPELSAALFAGVEDTLAWSCIQGVMGTVYADSQTVPTCAVASLGCFHIFAGTPCDALVTHLLAQPTKENYCILVPEGEGWSEVIQRVCGEKAIQIERYAICKEPDCFDRSRLERLRDSLPEGFVIRSIDKELYEFCKTQGWCEDFVSQYPTYGDYARLGLGFMVLKDEEPVAGCSSYSTYRDGIEIEIGTRRDYRRLGLGQACAATLILTCLDRGVYPSWDAMNLWSVALASKLGYHYSHAYTAFEYERN